MDRTSPRGSAHAGHGAPHPSPASGRIGPALAPGEARRAAEVRVERVEVAAYAIPTEVPESDGTHAWDRTTLVVVQAVGGGEVGLGYTYGDVAVAKLVESVLADKVRGRDAMHVPGAWVAMTQAVRNLGRPGIASRAIAAVDAALWDLKARILSMPLVTLLGGIHASVPVYGSGGFTSYSLKQLARQLEGWVDAGIPRVKMKIGREPGEDLERVYAARAAIGGGAELWVDANGAYDRKQALCFAARFDGLDVRWFEEPVSSDDLEGLRLVRDRAPPCMRIAAGEYGYDTFYFRRMLEAGAVDVLQADASRCGGITGFLKVVPLCEVHGVKLSAHTAPSLHLHACCAVGPLAPLEYFHDHVRIERELFDGAREPRGGALTPDLSRPGIGLELKRADARKYAI